ncbi:MAG TPA: TRAP transporter large permease subunit [Firmicutes bacterium]|nr:TRAP transporter large permease subunit [Bacillota bacterium]
MLSVLIPVAALFLIILIPLPKIGGEVRLGLLTAAFLAFLLGGVAPGAALLAAIDGIDRIAWVIGLSIFGSIYAQSQVSLGTMDTVLNTFRALFGRSPKGLIAAVLLTLVLAGSLLGDAIAAVTVIGVLVVLSLAELGLSPEETSVIILLGGILGSIMPPITQAFFLAAGLVGTPVDPVVNTGYVTVSLGVIVGLFTVWRYVRIKELPAELIPDRTAGRILAQEWLRLLPLAVLAGIVVLRSGFKVELLKVLDPLLPFAGVPIAKALTNRIIQAIIVATLVAFTFRRVRRDAGTIFRKGLAAVSKTVQIQLCAGVMIGAFYASGMIDQVVAFTKGLTPAALKLGGGAAMLLLGMLTGSQTTAQNTLVPFLGPILTQNLGVAPAKAALGAAHLAMAGQSMPPVCLTTFVVVGIVGGILAKKVDPVRVMLMALPVTLYFALTGLAAWFQLF